MPPQQGQHLLDFGHGFLGLGFHGHPSEVPLM
jgi:hypothetical protein